MADQEAEFYTAKRFIGGGGSLTLPTFSFANDRDTGFYRDGSNSIAIALGGARTYFMDTAGIGGANAAAFIVLNEVASDTNPTLAPDRSDVDTGIGHVAADALSLVAGGIEGLRLTEASSKVIVSAATSANVGLTADVGSAQGNGVILASYNVYDTVAVAGDAATLPAVFEVGTLIYVKNGAAANSMDVFPASGDDAGAGANTAVAIAAGNFKVFMGTTANATWEQIMGGTA